MLLVTEFTATASGKSPTATVAVLLLLFALKDGHGPRAAARDIVAAVIGHINHVGRRVRGYAERKISHRNRGGVIGSAVNHRHCARAVARGIASTFVGHVSI